MGLQWFLLAHVAHLAIAEIKFMHQGLAIEEMQERLRSCLKQAGAQAEQAPPEEGGDPSCEEIKMRNVRPIQSQFSSR